MIKINFWDKCGQGPHNTSCHAVHGKTSKTVQLLAGPSKEGVFSLFTGDAIKSVSKSTTDINIGWIQEPRALHGRHYVQLTAKFDEFFNNPDGKNYKYVYTHDKALIKRAPERFKFLLGNGFWIKYPDIYPKTKLCSMIASRKSQTIAQQYRCKWADRLSGQEGFYLFGRNRKEICDKEDGLCDFMFSLAMENDVQDSWITEKVFDCFATGTIPIYHGTKSIVEYFNPDGIIFLDEGFKLSQLSKNLYRSKLDAVYDNYERVKKLEIPLDYMFDDLYKELGITK